MLCRGAIEVLLRKSNVTQVAFYFLGVVEGGVDLQVVATFGAGANVNSKNTLEELQGTATRRTTWLY